MSGKSTQVVLKGTDLKFSAWRAFQGFGAQELVVMGGAILMS
jgi:hypothetical protein